MIGPPARLSQNAIAARQSSQYPGSDGRVDMKGTPAAQAPVALQAVRVAASDGSPHHAAGSNVAAARPPVDARRDPTPSGDVCRLLSLLADRTRLKILRILAGGERPVVALTGELKLPQPTVSHHLAWLRMMDLVSPRRQGKHVFYALGPAAQWDESGKLTLTADDATVIITPYTGG